MCCVSQDDFEVKIRRSQRTCREVQCDLGKIAAIVQKGIGDDDFIRHLLMHAARLSTYPPVLEGIRSITMARDTLTGVAPMDVSACQQEQGIRQRKGGKGKKSKGKGNNKEKEEGSRDEPWYRGDLSLLPPDRSPQARLQNIRERQGQEGCECRAASVRIDARGAAAAPSVTPSRVSTIELDDWILAVSLDDHEETVVSAMRVMVDRGAAVCV